MIKQLKAKMLMARLKDLFLRDGAGLELIEKGFYHKAKAAMPHFGGSIDKNTELLEEVKKVVLDLEKEI